MAGQNGNLRPWKPGQSGNPGGRPRKKPITDLYAEMLNDGATVQAIRAAVLRNIRGGKAALVPMLREMADRVEGKVTQLIDANVTDIQRMSDEELRERIQELEKKLFAGRTFQCPECKEVVPYVPQ